LTFSHGFSVGHGRFSCWFTARGGQKSIFKLENPSEAKIPKLGESSMRTERVTSSDAAAVPQSAIVFSFIIKGGGGGTGATTRIDQNRTTKITRSRQNEDVKKIQSKQFFPSIFFKSFILFQHFRSFLKKHFFSKFIFFFKIQIHFQHFYSF
jgi:hypothetical protein